MLNEVVTEYVIGDWVLIQDADQLFICPDFETPPMTDLESWLEGHNADAMAAPLMDMHR